MKTGFATKLIVLLALASVLFTAQYASAIDRQEASNWCWAACIQDVAADEGVRLDQSDIVERLYGNPQDAPASTHDVINLLDSYGMRAHLATRPPANANELYGSLQRGYRFIALVFPQGGQVGHFVVISDYYRDGSLVLEDPADGRTYRVQPHEVLASNWVQTIVVHP